MNVSCRCHSLIVAAFIFIAGHSLGAADAYSSSDLSVAPSSGPRLTPLNESGQITEFGNQIGIGLYRTNQVLLNGSGVSLGDVNGDGKTDIFATRVEGSNRLLINQGDWQFEGTPDEAISALSDRYSTGSVLVDLDGDHDLDLLVATILKGVYVFQNDGSGRFTDVTASSGVTPGLGAMSITVGDYDLDGQLDFYVAHYRASALMDVPNARMNLGVQDGKRVITHFNGRSVDSPDLRNRFYVDERGGIGEYGELDHLYRNLGGLRFEKIEFTHGAFLDEDGAPLDSPPYDWGLAAAFRDINQDGLPDLYVCNDFDTPDRIWINQGRGQFKALPRLAMRQSSWFSMGVDFADINRDGWDDFLTLDMLGSTHRNRMTQLGDMAPPEHLIKSPSARPQFLKTCLFLNGGDGFYQEIGQYAGVAATDWAWCPAFIDIDLDGWEDLLVTNGNERDGRNLDIEAELKALRAQGPMSDDKIFTERMRFPRLPSANLAYRNNRDGTFTEIASEWGFGHHGVSHGMALGDLDNDGDLDVVVSHLNEPLGIYRNDSGKPRIAVKLKGRGGNTGGVGARIEVHSGNDVQAQEIMVGGRYLSSDEAIRTFGVGQATQDLRVVVHWPGGAVSRVEGVRPNREYELLEPETSSQQATNREQSVGEAWFEDVSELVPFRHHREDFDDFGRQPLIPRRYGDLGPGVSWFDIDDDGFDDVIVGTGRGGRLGVYRNNEGDAFAVYDRPPFHQASSRDVTSVLGVRFRPKDPAVLMGLSNYEDGLSLGATVGLYRFRSQSPVVIRGGSESSVGPLALADWDQDGDLDLFVGARSLTSRLPQAGQTVWLENRDGKFVEREDIEDSISSLGVVNGAVFTDLDQDSDPDLVLAMEWGALEVLINENGRFTRETEAWGLSEYTGWWNGVSAGDFNQDGRMDLVATNWGYNSPYRRYSDRPLKLYHGDLDGNGQHDLIFGAFDSALEREVPLRQLGLLASGMPSMRTKFPRNADFAAASIEEILEGAANDPARLESRWMASTVFMNQGDRFAAQPLPVEAQYSPAFGVAVADFDSDGRDDLFLGQNFFGVRRDVARYDAGWGLLLRGQGDGRFVAVTPRESGIRIAGEQRGVAVADMDRDGRTDLMVSQNGGPLRLFRGQQSRRGVQVRLIGAPGNEDAVGASLWLSSEAARGSQVEIRSGSGYLSQNSTRPVLTLTEKPTTLNVIWPDGQRTQYPVGPDDVSITVNRTGRVE